MAKWHVLLDLNVVLDVLQQRQSHYVTSARVMNAIAKGKIEGLLAAHSLTTLFYLVWRARDAQTAITAITQLLQTFTVAAINQQVILQALALGWKDFEDAVQIAAASHAGADFLVTRNPKDFKRGIVPVLQPAELLALLV